MFDLQIDKKKEKQKNVFNEAILSTGSTKTQCVRPNRKVVADRAGTNVRK
jgi:hypothetical protein